MRQEEQARKTWKEYEAGKQYLSRPLWGNKSLYDRVQVNNRYYEGDQWKDLDSGADLPVFNIAKRIGQAQTAIIGSNVLTAQYTFEGIDLPEQGRLSAAELAGFFAEECAEQRRPSGAEMRAVAALLTKYFRTVAERCRLDQLVRDALTDAFQNGSAVLHHFWNPALRTSLEEKGDVDIELLDILQVHFGDPSCDRVQKQPYIIVESRQPLQAVRAEARANGMSAQEAESIRPDRECRRAAYEREDLAEEGHVTVLLKYWKEEVEGRERVFAQKSTKQHILRKQWDIGIEWYPISLMRYEKKRGSIYAHTPLTEIIPNQRVANTLRYNQVLQDSYTAQPILVYDASRIGEITNEIGGKIPVTGPVGDSIRYLQGTDMAPSSESLARTFLDDTLEVNNVNAALRGDLNPENTSAIIALRDAAKMPLQRTAANLYEMFEDTARIVGAFLLACYGRRRLKVEEGGGVCYIPFRAARYRDAMLAVRVDVGESTLWSETATVRTLDNMLSGGFINLRQYLERIPDGYVPKKQELLAELRADEAQQDALPQEQIPAAQ